MERRLVEPLFFLVLLVGTCGVVFFLFRPFLYTLILAAILAYLTHGIFTRLLRILRSPSWTALCMTVLVLVTLVVPLTLIGIRIVSEASGLYATLITQTSQGDIARSVAWTQEHLGNLLPGVTFAPQQITDRIGSALNWVIGSLGGLLGSVASLVLNFVLLLLFYFYLVRDGERLIRQLKDLSPLPDDQEDTILSKLGRSVTTTVRGSLVIALLQGLVSSTGYIIFGLPNPALWGMVIVFAAFVPTLGTALVQIPAVLYLAFSGHLPQAVGLGIWAMIGVGFLDNVLSPKLMARGTHMHPLVMLLALLGGVAFYGPLGILLGPLTVALLYALLEIYRSIIRSGHPHPQQRLLRSSRGV